MHIVDITHLDALTRRLLASAARLEQCNRSLGSAAAQLRWRSPAGRLCQHATDLLRLRSASAAHELTGVAAELRVHARRAAERDALAERAVRAATRAFLP